MKIGKFAELYGLTINTIRYYMEIGLLIPSTSGKQYDFDEQCQKDMELILKLKHFRFSINRILQVVSLYRYSRFAINMDIEGYLDFLRRQIAELQNEQSELASIVQEMQHEVRVFESRIPTVRRSGVPLSMLHLLCCPDCGRELDLDGAQIESRSVIFGNLHCECGYQARIEGGIVKTSGGRISDYDFPDLERHFYLDMSADLMGLLQKSYNRMNTVLRAQELTGKVILEDHLNSYCFLQPNLTKLPSGAKFILVDKYPEIVEMYKRSIESMGLELDILYIADSTFRYPLKRGAVDIFIDFSSSNEFQVFDRRQLLEVLRPCFRGGVDGTAVVGTYFYFEPNAESFSLLQEQYPENCPGNYDRRVFEALLARLSAAPSFEVVGETTNSGSGPALSFHKRGEVVGAEAFTFIYEE